MSWRAVPRRVLTGLVFVAVTLHVTPIIGNVLHRDRAWSSVAILASQLIIAMAVLVPAQPLWFLAVEILVISVLWAIRTIRVTRELSSAMRRLNRPSVSWQVEWPAWIGWVVALAGSGVALFDSARSAAGGACVTVTVNVQVLVLPAPSTAVHVTGVSPSGKVEPDGGTQLVETTEQLSLDVGEGNVTTEVVVPNGTLDTMLPEHMMKGLV